MEKLNKEDVAIFDKFAEQVRFLRKDADIKRDWTCMIELETIHRVRYAIVLAWMDYDNNGDWRLYAKLGYKSIFSIMDEYNIDWMMPYNKKTGDVVFDEVLITNTANDFKTLYNQWKVLKLLIDQNYNEIEFGQKTRKVEV